MSQRISKITPVLKGHPNWDTVLETIMDVFECQTGTLHHWNELKEHLELLYHKGVPKELIPKIQLIPNGKGIAGAAAERMEPVQICNLQTDTSGVARPSAKKTKVEGALAVPVEFGGLLMGTLGIGKQTAYEFTAEEIRDIQQLASTIGEKWADGYM